MIGLRPRVRIRQGAFRKSGNKLRLAEVVGRNGKGDWREAEVRFGFYI